MQKIKVGDTVVLLAGKDKGRTGRVMKKLKIDRFLVEGLNLVKKHVRANPQANQEGGIIEREAGIHVSNLAVLNPQTNRADRVGFKVLENGSKVRYFKSNGEVVDV
jgi:large subunit ribosomal protein L24